MNLNQTIKTYEADIETETACGARIKISPATPFVRYRDEIVYFCGQDCKQLFDSDPIISCLASRLLSCR